MIRETVRMLQNMVKTQKMKFLKMPKLNKIQMTMELLRKQTTVLTMWSAVKVQHLFLTMS